MTSYSLLFLGVILGMLIQKYIFPVFDMLLDIYSYKQSEKVTIYQLNAQEQIALFNREYPEVNNEEIRELTPAIGFTYSNQDNDIYCDDEECKTIK
jgi:hypothetical protein